MTHARTVHLLAGIRWFLCLVLIGWCSSSAHAQRSDARELFRRARTACEQEEWADCARMARQINQQLGRPTLRVQPLLVEALAGLEDWEAAREALRVYRGLNPPSETALHAAIDGMSGGIERGVMIEERRRESADDFRYGYAESAERNLPSLRSGSLRDLGRRIETAQEAVRLHETYLNIPGGRHVAEARAGLERSHRRMRALQRMLAEERARLESERDGPALVTDAAAGASLLGGRADLISGPGTTSAWALSLGMYTLLGPADLGLGIGLGLGEYRGVSYEALYLRAHAGFAFLSVPRRDQNRTSLLNLSAGLGVDFMAVATDGAFPDEGQPRVATSAFAAQTFIIDCGLHIRLQLEYPFFGQEVFAPGASLFIGFGSNGTHGELAHRC